VCYECSRMYRIRSKYETNTVFASRLQCNTLCHCFSVVVVAIVCRAHYAEKFHSPLLEIFHTIAAKTSAREVHPRCAFNALYAIVYAVLRTNGTRISTTCCHVSRVATDVQWIFEASSLPYIAKCATPVSRVCRAMWCETVNTEER